MVQELQIAGLEGSIPTNGDLVDSYYYDPITGEYWYASTDPTTGLIHWYKYSVSAAAYVYAFSTRWVAAPKTIILTVGNKLRIYADFYYVGPIFSGKLYGAIGSRGVGDSFDEKLNNSIALSLPQCSSSTRFQGKYVDISITSAIAAGTYAIYIKIINGVSLELDKTLSSYYENAVQIVGVQPTFSGFDIDWSKTAKV